jgi:hypothetical protein
VRIIGRYRPPFLIQIDALYLFKHALLQDAAYGTLLREPRRALHRRIAETLEREFAEIAENQPELLARHCAETGLIEKAANLWGKVGRRSLVRSALVEAAEQLTRALAHMASLPTTPALRRTEIELQLALSNTLFLVKGFAAPEPRGQWSERASCSNKLKRAVRLLQIRCFCLQFTLASGLIASALLAGDDMHELAERALALGEEQGTTVPLLPILDPECLKTHGLHQRIKLVYISN